MSVFSDKTRIPTHRCTGITNKFLSDDKPFDLKTFTLDVPGAWASSSLVTKYPCVEALAWANIVLADRCNSDVGGAESDFLEIVAIDTFYQLCTLLLLSYATKGQELIFDIFPCVQRCLKTEVPIVLPRHIFMVKFEREEKTNGPTSTRITVEFDGQFVDFKQSTRVPGGTIDWTSLLLDESE